MNRRGVCVLRELEKEGGSDREGFDVWDLISKKNRMWGL